MESSGKHKAFHLASVFAIDRLRIGMTGMESPLWSVSWVVRFGVPTV